MNDKNTENNLSQSGVASNAVEGIVKWYNEQKGYGFIEQANGRDLFVHYTAIRGKLKQGDKVSYELSEGKKGPCATKVKVVETSSADDTVIAPVSREANS